MPAAAVRSGKYTGTSVCNLRRLLFMWLAKKCKLRSLGKQYLRTYLSIITYGLIFFPFHFRNKWRLSSCCLLWEIQWYFCLHSKKFVVHVEGKKMQADKFREVICADLCFSRYLRTQFFSYFISETNDMSAAAVCCGKYTGTSVCTLRRLLFMWKAKKCKLISLAEQYLRTYLSDFT